MRGKRINVHLLDADGRGKSTYCVSGLPRLAPLVYSFPTQPIKDFFILIVVQNHLIMLPMETLCTLFVTLSAVISSNVFAAGGAVVLGLMLSIWCVSLIIKDASIIDMFWGGGFALIALAGLAVAQNTSPLGLATALLVVLWGARLFQHLFLRWRKTGAEDYRYQKMRSFHGRHFWWRSFFVVFTLQGILMYLVAMPYMVALQVGGIAAAPVASFIGLGIAFCGLLMEALADIQLAKFRSTAQAGALLTDGWWARTRHPNYFGDALFWWGIYIAVVAATPEAIWTIYAPALMSFLLVKISGAAMLERRLIKKPGYADYMQKTNRFIPKIF